MARRKTTKKTEAEDKVEDLVVLRQPKELTLPFNELWQNVVWYCRIKGNKITYEDLQQYHYTTFDQYKEHIDKL